MNNTKSNIKIFCNKKCPCLCHKKTAAGHCEEQELTRHSNAFVLQKLSRVVELLELQYQGRVL